MKAFTKTNKLNILTMLALLWLVSFGVFGQTFEQEWKLQNPIPTLRDLNDVYFADSQNGWAVGYEGTILKTTNGGTTWIQVNSGIQEAIFSTHFTDLQNGWSVGSHGSILSTNNGGHTWQNQNSGTTKKLLSVYFNDSQRGWAVGDSGAILNTDNGGSNWQILNLGITGRISSIQFADSLNGWINGEIGKILKTTNAGTSWQTVSTGRNYVLTAMYFSDPRNGWAIASDSILYSKDGGLSWTSRKAQFYFQTLQFTDSLNGFMLGYQTNQRTTDGGNTWQNFNVELSSVSSVYFISPAEGYVVGNSGIVIKTTNGGIVWENQTGVTTRDLSSVHFTDTQNGWVAGGSVLKTTDGGSSWQKQRINGTKVFFVNRDVGWVLGSSLYRTSNGGNTWDSTANIDNYFFGSIHFVSSKIGWAVGKNKMARKTTDGGITWQVKDNGLVQQYDMRSVFFIDSLKGWITSWYGSVFQTIDGGNNWNWVHVSSVEHLNSVYFVDTQNGWVVGNNNKIYKSTNGGVTWQSSSNIPGYDITSVHFTDLQNGWAINRGILKTTDGGTTWQTLQSSSSYSYNLNTIYFTDPLHGWAVGYYGVILTTSTNNPINPETPTSLIAGNLFEKTTGNCNPSQIPVLNRLVKAIPGPYYGISDIQGNYNLRLPLADTATSYTLQALENQNPAFNVEAVCPPNNQYTVLLDTIPDTLSGKNFGFDITPCHHLDVQIASNRRRRCFRNTTSISYTNLGSLSAAEAYVLVDFPSWVRPLSSSRSFVALNDSVWRFNLDTVSAGGIGSFTITDSVLCGHPEIIGLSQCTKATIFPAPDCPSPNWNGASISTSGKCLGNSVIQLGIFNRTAFDMTDSSDYKVYIDSILVKQAKVKLVSGDSLILNVSANGSGVHLVASQVAFHPTEIFSTTTVESCSLLPGSGISKTLSTRFPFAQSPSSKTHCLEIRDSYDPNDKQAFPRGFTNQNIIPPNSQLEYLVRFQNTGNDTAFTVYVIDTLDQNLNVESLELGASSHSYQISLQTIKSGKTFIRWQFDNILLPDSNINELRSHGFVQYRISPKPGLALGSKVRNHAEIYFDFNPPVITNQTLTTFDNVTYTDPSLNNNVTVLVPTGVSASVRKRMRLYPNPVTASQLKIHFEESGRLTLFDAQGKEVWHSVSLQGDQTIPVHLRTGMYLARIISASHSWTEKVVVE